jgi:hypothetical protein
MNKALKILFLISLVLCIYSYFRRDKLPEKSEILSAMYAVPVQSATDKREFKTTRAGVEYTVTPLFAYTINGLVVALHHSRSWVDLFHKEWGDYFNSADIAVIWGDNLAVADYKKVSFSHTDFTVEWSYETDVHFKGNCVANNHLLTDNDDLEKKILRARVGDQIEMQGYLVRYAGGKGGYARSSSVTRDDARNGACEVIYVTDFKMLKEANPVWRVIYVCSKYLTALLLLILFLGPIFETLSLTRQLRGQVPAE